jgi:2-polyprenyl-3-methyl-5-hydroxy-6-metoxy-1,4-benzoquinol methylase
MGLENNMIDDVNDIAVFYDRNQESEHSRLDRHQLEFDLTWRYLNQYLPPQGTILEVGSATGKYTLELARRSYTITAVDLSKGLLEQCRENITREGLEKQVQFVLADARNLREIAKNKFDVVLLMGPLYHLIQEADRKMALKASFDRLREDGILFSSFISRFGLMSDLLRNVPSWIEDQADVWSVLEHGKDSEDHPRGGFRGYFAQPREIAPLHEDIGFHTRVLAGVEPVISADDESYNQLQGKQRQQWLDVLYRMSGEPSILGASRHLLYIGQKIGGKDVQKG